MKIGWRGALGLLLSALLLWWTLKGVSFVEVRDQLRTANVWLLLLSAVIATAPFPLRAIRWQLILEPAVPRVRLGALWRAVAIGMMVNNVVPARAGELARVFALTREDDRVGFVAGFASLAVDRVFDAVVLIAMLVSAMLAPAFPGNTVIAGQPASRYAIVFAAGAFGLLAALYLFVFAPEFIERLFVAIVHRISPPLALRGQRVLHTFVAGLGALREPKRFLLVLAWTVLHWLVAALAFYVAFVAVGVRAPFSAAVFLQGLIAIGVALPSSPGFFGVFEGSAIVGLAVYGVGKTQAVSWAFGYHILSFIPITVLGAYYFARLGLHFRDMREDGPAPTTPVAKERAAVGR